MQVGTPNVAKCLQLTRVSDLVLHCCLLQHKLLSVSAQTRQLFGALTDLRFA